MSGNVLNLLLLSLPVQMISFHSFPCFGQMSYQCHTQQLSVCHKHGVFVSRFLALLWRPEVRPDQGPLKGDPWRCPQMSTQRSLKIWTPWQTVQITETEMHFWKSVAHPWNGYQLTRSQARVFQDTISPIHPFMVNRLSRSGTEGYSNSHGSQAEIGPNGPTKLVGALFRGHCSWSEWSRKRMSKTKIRIATVDFKAAIDLISNAIAVYYSCVTLYNGILQQMSDVQRRALGAGLWNRNLEPVSALVQRCFGPQTIRSGVSIFKTCVKTPWYPPVHTRKPAEMDVDFYTKTYGFDPNIDLIITWLLFPPQCETWTLAAVLTAQKLIELGGHSWCGPHWTVAAEHLGQIIMNKVSWGVP